MEKEKAKPIDYRERLKMLIIAIDFFKDEYIDEFLDTVSLKEIQEIGSEMNMLIQDGMEHQAIISAIDEDDDDEEYCDCPECKKEKEESEKKTSPIINSPIQLNTTATKESEQFIDGVFKKMDPKFDGKA